MTIMQTLQTLVDTQNHLMQLQGRLANHAAIMKDETMQAFVFDLRDYLDSLRVVTDFVAPTAAEFEQLEVNELSHVLADQNKLLRTLIEELNELEETQQTQTFFALSEGEVRRLVGSLTGVLELNGLNLQDNLTFQRQFKELGEKLPEATIEPTTPEKGGLFKRLFGKK